MGSLGRCNLPGGPGFPLPCPSCSDGEEGEEGPWVGVWEEKGGLELSPAGAARSCRSLAQGAGHAQRLDAGQ